MVHKQCRLRLIGATHTEYLAYKEDLTQAIAGKTCGRIVDRVTIPRRSIAD